MRYPSFARIRRYAGRFTGRTLEVSSAGLASAVLLALLVLVLPLLAELLSTGGSLTIPAADASVVNRLGMTPATVDAKFARYDRDGMLPTVWRLRNSWIGPSLREAFVRFPPLRSNQGYLLSLIAAVWALALFSAAALYWLDRAVQGAACRVASGLRRQIHAQAHQLVRVMYSSAKRQFPSSCSRIKSMRSAADSSLGGAPFRMPCVSRFS